MFAWEGSNETPDHSCYQIPAVWLTLGFVSTWSPTRSPTTLTHPANTMSPRAFFLTVGTHWSNA